MILASTKSNEEEDYYKGRKHFYKDPKPKYRQYYQLQYKVSDIFILASDFFCSFLS